MSPSDKLMEQQIREGKSRLADRVSALAACGVEDGTHCSQHRTSARNSNFVTRTEYEIDSPSAVYPGQHEQAILRSNESFLVPQTHHWLGRSWDPRQMYIGDWHSTIERVHKLSDIQSRVRIACSAFAKNL